MTQSNEFVIQNEADKETNYFDVGSFNLKEGNS